MEKARIPVKILREGARLPQYGSAFAAGADLYACLEKELTIEPGLATKRGLAPANKVGVIDCDYRGELLVALYNQSAEEQTVLPGERIAQLVVTPYIPAEFEETEALSETQRGEGGFGSTGRI